MEKLDDRYLKGGFTDLALTAALAPTMGLVVGEVWKRLKARIEFAKNKIMNVETKCGSRV